MVEMAEQALSEREQVNLPDSAPETGKPVRVGLLIASLSQGGAEHVALSLLRNLNSAGVDTYLLTLDRDRELLDSGPRTLDQTLSSRCIGLSRASIGWNTVFKVLMFPWQWLMLQHTIRRLRLDVVISLMERSNIANLLTFAGHQRVLSIHSYPESLLSSKGPLKRFLIKRSYPLLLRRADRIVFVSKQAEAGFRAMFTLRPDQPVVIYNMCEADEFKALARRSLSAEHLQVFQRTVVITHGRLVEDKGYRHLIRAFREISRTNSDLRLVILGQGPLEPDLRRLCRELAIQDRVLFPGFQSNPMPWLVRAHLFVLPSLREGLPGSLLEAMALGVPIVSTDCRSGPRELLAPGTSFEQRTPEIEFTPCGLLTSPLERKCPDAGEALTRAERWLARAMARMLADEKLRAACVDRARERAREFSPEMITRQWMTLIRQIPSSQKSGPHP